MYDRHSSIQAGGIGQQASTERRRMAPRPLSSAAVTIACFTQQRAAAQLRRAQLSRVLTRRFRRITDFPPLRDGALHEYGTSVGVRGEGSPGAASICQQIPTSPDTSLLRT